MGALDQAVRSGKAIYAAISNYPGALTAEAVALTRQNRMAVPILHQPAYHMLHRTVEKDLLSVTQRFGLGVIAFCPLAQGLLTNKYLSGIPKDSRAGIPTGFLRPSQITAEKIEIVRRLNEIAQSRGQSLAQMALAWTLRLPGVTSALIGASRPGQIKENVAALERSELSAEELAKIDSIVGQ